MEAQAKRALDFDKLHKALADRLTTNVKAKADSLTSLLLREYLLLIGKDECSFFHDDDGDIIFDFIDPDRRSLVATLVKFDFIAKNYLFVPPALTLRVGKMESRQRICVFIQENDLSILKDRDINAQSAALMPSGEFENAFSIASLFLPYLPSLLCTRFRVTCVYLPSSSDKDNTADFQDPPRQDICHLIGASRCFILLCVSLFHGWWANMVVIHPC